LLGNGAWQAVLAAIPSDYRYIIIDTPPVLAASESLVLAKAADASLVCAMRDVSRMDQVRKASERLQAAGSRVIGTVLNGVPTRQYAYRYGTYAHRSG
jgi:tyrosine-protein kinase Etk/Wzc